MSAAPARGTHAGSLYGVVELDANLKNTIKSLETATSELKNLATLDLDYKMPGLAAFRSDTEHMISMLHGVCFKVENALKERRNESKIMVDGEMSRIFSTSSSSNVSMMTTEVKSDSSMTTISPCIASLVPSKKRHPVSTVVYDFEVKLRLTK